MGLFDLFNTNNEQEEEMDNLNLEDWQKKLVREGKYSPFNFEEDDSIDVKIGKLSDNYTDTVSVSKI